MIWPAVRNILFRLDAESAHDLGVAQLERIQDVPPFLAAVRNRLRDRTPLLPVVLWGLEFRNPLGIAAGFDKNARVVRAAAALGFGFLEIGTVTPWPQSGNPRPRMFRIPEHRALINRLGFNNDGAAVVASRLRELWTPDRLADLPPLFVNIGKNRDVNAGDAPDAYADAYRRLAGLGDGIVVNVSSPNTRGLRALQEGENLTRILEHLRAEREKIPSLRGGARPILVKIAPDLDDEQLESVCGTCTSLADGIVATNTTIQRPAGIPDDRGGLSGAPLRPISTAVLQKARALVGERYPIIGVGGVMDGDDARLKLDAGAQLVQAYTGFVYGGPSWPREVVRRLAWWRDTEAR